jgi:hypothetical protein
MRLNEFMGSIFDSFPEPEESYREGCFSYQKWHLDTDSKDVKWSVIRREFVTLNEQVIEWIGKFKFPETTTLDAKRLIWDINYEDYKKYHFTSPITIALCALKIACDLKKIDFFSSYTGCIEMPKIGYTTGPMRVLLRNNFPDAGSKEKIRFQSSQLLELIGKERVERLKRMWGCMDEAKLLA